MPFREGHRPDNSDKICMTRTFREIGITVTTLSCCGRKKCGGALKGKMSALKTNRLPREPILPIESKLGHLDAMNSLKNWRCRHGSSFVNHPATLDHALDLIDPEMGEDLPIVRNIVNDKIRLLADLQRTNTI